MPWRGFEVLVVSPTPTHPQDHGNRKRIFEICNELKRQGARIHFVHYPAEHDWRNRRRFHSESEMAAAWDSYQLVAPSRPLHDNAIAVDHAIDEWADGSLNHYITWACRTQPIDLVIVNYTWMSFCLDAVPAGIFRVCDTHDAFSGRRALLEAHGIAAEFFHTTPSEEKRGLARADLVWAIKPEEQTYFETNLGLPNVLTMLHAEPDHFWWKGPSSKDGWLRAGVIGARNNINRYNLERFLNEALPVIETYMAPVKIVIAGGCAQDFEGWSHPNVEVIGRVPEVADFYRNVDIVLAPMEFSTGLKIKVAEALAAGAPILVHRHAMEGFPSDEALHQLPSYRAMALELVKLAFDRTRLAELAKESRIVTAGIRTSVQKALEATRRQVVAQLSKEVLIVVPVAALDPYGVLYDHLITVLEYLRFAGNFVVCLTGIPQKKLTTASFLVGYNVRIFIDAEAMAAWGGEVPEGWTATTLSDLLETRGFETAYFMGDGDGKLVPTSIQRLRRAFVRYDAIELAGGDPSALIEFLGATATVYVVSSRADRLMGWRSHFGVDSVIEAPYRRNGSFECAAFRAGQSTPRKQLGILGSPESVLVCSLVELAMRMGSGTVVVDTDDAELRRNLSLMPGSRREEGPLADLARCDLVVDLSRDDSLAAVLVEAVRRNGIPTIGLPRGATAIQDERWPRALFPNSVRRLVNTVAQALGDREFLDVLRAETRTKITSETANDAGWTWIWHIVSRRDIEPKVTVAAPNLLGLAATAV